LGYPPKAAKISIANICSCSEISPMIPCLFPRDWKRG
jgi:hypothetical protein